MRMTGQSNWPPVRQWMLPISLMIWQMPLGRKSANWMKPTGLPPAMARPMVPPMMVGSVRRGVLNAAGEVGGQATGDAEDVALGVFDVFAEQDHAGVGVEAVAEGVAHGLDHEQAPEVSVAFLDEAGFSWVEVLRR